MYHASNKILCFFSRSIYPCSYEFKSCRNLPYLSHVLVAFQTSYAETLSICRFSAPMKRPRPSSGTVILTYCIFFVPLSNAFILTDRCPLRRAAPRYEVGRYFQTYLPDRCGLKMMSSASWESNDRADIIRGIMEWQERDEEIGAAGLRILTESSPSGGKLRSYSPAWIRSSRPYTFVNDVMTMLSCCNPRSVCCLRSYTSKLLLGMLVFVPKALVGG